MKKNYIAYIAIGLAISFLIIYIVMDTLANINITKEIVVIENNIVEDESRVEEYIIENLIENIKPVIEEKKFEPVFNIKTIDQTLIKLMVGVSFHNRGLIQFQDLKLLEVTYLDFMQKPQIGFLIVNHLVAEEVLEIFEILYEQGYLIDKINLVYNYQGDDNLSMADNNTHSFNDRMVGKSNKISNHAYGLAIDINPIQNPYINGEIVLPSEAISFKDRKTYQQGMILKDDVCYSAFIQRGWTWGGNWTQLKDYQHFEKTIINVND